jgi:hypothetical protein
MEKSMNNRKKTDSTEKKDEERMNKARETLGSRGLSADLPCKNCLSCKVKCSLGFDVKSRALGIMRILA